jgi:TonB family protein
MPVIIAAGLHGALWYFSSDKIPAPPRPPKDPPVLMPDGARIEIADRPEDSAETGAGKVDPLPSQHDIERPANPEDIFTVQVTPAAESLKPVTMLPSNPPSLIGSGEIGIGGPRLPSDAIHLDRAPRATVRPSPVYPGNLRTTDGSVTVEFIVDTTGHVVTASAIRWTHRDFVDPAVRAVLRWRFEPGTINGRTVSFRMAIPIEFIATN